MAAGPLPNPPAGSTEIERLRSEVATYFPVYETRLTPNSLILLVHVDPANLEERFDRLRQALWAKFYVAQVRREGGEYLVEIVRRPPRRPWGLTVNLVLLAITILTTVAAGAFLWVAYVGGSTLGPSDFLWGGITFALPLLGILGLHELAHYLTARRHHVEASLPFFIPVPPPFLIFGTFGAFISLREPIPDKKALLDIGASGPLAGFALSVPITLFGMFLSAHSPVLSVANCGPSFAGVDYGSFVFGTTSFFWWLLGQFLPVNLVNLSPVALAGWVGILVTAINLLPAGQLDGGHVFRALLGDRSRYVSYAATILLFGLGFLYEGWFIFAVLILLLGLRHPPPLNDLTPLDGRRWVLGGLAAFVLVGGFVLVPIATPTNAFALENPASGPAPLPPGYALAENLSVQIVNQDGIPHGYLVNASVVKVVQGGGGAPTQPLQGAQLASYLANSTWVVVLPNGNTTTFTGTGSFALAPSDYAEISAGAGASLNVTYENPQQAVVTITLTVSQICSAGGTGPSAQTFTVY